MVFVNVFGICLVVYGSCIVQGENVEEEKMSSIIIKIILSYSKNKF